MHHKCDCSRRQSDDAEATFQTLCATGTGMTDQDRKNRAKWPGRLGLGPREPQELQDYYDLCLPLVGDGCTVPARLQTSLSGSMLSESLPQAKEPGALAGFLRFVESQVAVDLRHLQGSSDGFWDS